MQRYIAAMALAFSVGLAGPAWAQTETPTPTVTATLTATPTPTVTATPRRDRDLALLIAVVADTDSNPVRAIHVPAPSVMTDFLLANDLLTPPTETVSAALGRNAALFIYKAGAEADWTFAVSCQPNPGDPYIPLVGSPCGGAGISPTGCIWSVLPACNDLTVQMMNPPVSGSYTFGIGVLLPQNVSPDG
jgi:hypothetical protein